MARSPDVAVERGDRIWVAWQVLEDGKHNIYVTDPESEEWSYAQYVSV